jgi:hypothetical protein
MSGVRHKYMATRDRPKCVIRLFRRALLDSKLMIYLLEKKCHTAIPSMTSESQSIEDKC